jgi:hypothetical protein
METQTELFVPSSKLVAYLQSSRHFCDCYNCYSEQLCWRRPAAKYYSTFPTSDGDYNSSELGGSCTAVSSGEAIISVLV